MFLNPFIPNEFVNAKPLFTLNVHFEQNTIHFYYYIFYYLNRTLLCFSSSNLKVSEDPFSLSTSDDEDKKTGTKSDKKQKKSGRKATWSDSLVNDMVDIIVNNDYYTKKLIFVNTKNKKNAEIYGRILVELRVRASERGEALSFTAVQMRTKFKKLISECKKAALTIKSATGIKRFQEDKGYGSWFDQLYPLVKTRDSCQPEQAIEPSSEGEVHRSSTSSPETLESEVSGNLFVPLKIKKAKKESHMNEVVGMLKTLVEKDPMQDFIAFAKEEEEKSRQQELRLMELMMRNNQPRAEAPQFQNHGMQSHQNVNQVYGQTNWQPNDATILQQYAEENGQIYYKF